jgi:4-alpha-glucanotransferase
LYGVQPAYYDVNDRLQSASAESLQRILSALGAPLARPADAAAALRERRQELWGRVVGPVAVAWDGECTLNLRLPAAAARGTFRSEIVNEQGGTHTWSGELEGLATVAERLVESTQFVVKRLPVNVRLPTGYHRLTIDLGAQCVESTLIAAPQTAYRHTRHGRSGTQWGVFVPAYALHRASSWGGGDLSDLEALIDWVSELGGSLVATLPLLAWLSEVSDDPSPYSPASRLFWNEFYLDVARVPEFPGCAAARAAAAAPEMQSTLADLRGARIVDYRRQMEARRRVLRALADSFFSADSPRRTALEQFCRDHPEAERYARFRAVGELRQQVWPLWPQRLREGDIRPGDYRDRDVQYHLYAQWQMEQQLQRLAADARRRDMLWYLDFPLGVNSAGYDVWRERDVFGLDASGGAPPDAFFTKGQNWGFPPLHPERLRAQGYRYLIQSLRRHLQYARLLRIDHVMSLHRLYWVPNGMDARDGAYVRYRSDELFAILVVESHRHQAQIVGENLGTVPEALDAAMQRHGLLDMYVVQYESQPGRTPALRDVPSATVASLNTHDMPPFASFWTGLDVDDRADLDLMSPDEASAERTARAATRRALSEFLRRRGVLSSDAAGPHEVLRAFLAWLASSPAEIVLVTLEDLWEETCPQNTPGTYLERVNWRRKTRYTLEQMRSSPNVVDALRMVASLRRREDIPRAAESTSPAASHEPDDE